MVMGGTDIDHGRESSKIRKSSNTDETEHGAGLKRLLVLKFGTILAPK